MSNGIIIVHYNDYESLKHLVDNVKDYNVLDKVIIVDNNSRKEIVEKIRLITSDKVILIENKDNKGFSYAINIGAKKCKELGIDNIIISNSDVIIKEEKDLSTLISYLDDSKVGVVGPVIEEFNTLSRGWKNPSPILDALMNIVGVHRYIRNEFVFYKNNHYADEISEVEVVSGCFFLMKRATLEEINYFDENVFLYYEENILAKKVENAGKKCIIVNGVHVIHNHSVSIDKNIKKIKKLKMQKRSQYYFQKEYNRANIIERLFLKTTAVINRFILRIVYLFKK